MNISLSSTTGKTTGAIQKPLRGFSLVELLVVMSLVALLVLNGLPLTAAWVNSAKITDSEGILNEAVARTKTTALRNEFGMEGSDASAIMCISDGTISVRSAAADTPATCASTTVWSNTLSDGVDVKVGTVALACICFDNKGQTTSTNCGSCSTSTNLNLIAGNENATVSFF